jgi:replicative DNA helicase
MKKSGVETVPIKLPSAPDVEAAVLGACLTDAVVLPTVVPMLDRACFLDPANMQIFLAIQALVAKDSPVDVVSVAEELRDATDGHSITDQLMSVSSGRSSSENAEHYAHILLEYRVLRDIVRLSARTQVLAQSGEDVFEIVEKVRSELDVLSRGLSTGDTQKISEAVEMAQNLLANIYLDPDSLGVLNFGFKDLDHVTGGCLPGQLVVIGGKRKSGKTALMLHAVLHNSGRGKPCSVFSLEMGAAELALRQTFVEARVEFVKVFHNTLTDIENEKLKLTFGTVSKLPVFINDKLMHLGEIMAEAMRLKRVADTKMVVVDYLQLVVPPSGKDDSREQQVANISRSLKRLAKKLNVVVFALTQLNEQSQSRESRGIEADADKLIYLDAHEEEEVACGDHGKLVDVKIIQRFGVSGRFGDFQLMFDKRYGAFENYSPFDSPPSTKINSQLPF